MIVIITISTGHGPQRPLRHVWKHAARAYGTIEVDTIRLIRSWRTETPRGRRCNFAHLAAGIFALYVAVSHGGAWEPLAVDFAENER